MTGFETMRSEVNQFLHPRVNPSDKHDPTFLGLSHKRRVHSSNPNSPASSLMATLSSGYSLRGSEKDNQGLNRADQWLLHRGKRCDTSGPRHDPRVLTQDPAMAQPFNPKGDLRECRFGKGFERRLHSAIDAERPRLEAEAVRAEKNEGRQTLVRQRHADRARPLDLLTWQPTVVSSHFDTENSRATKYSQFNYQSTISNAAPQQPDPNEPAKSSQLQPPLYPSTAADKPHAKRTFSDRYETTVGPPAPTPEPGTTQPAVQTALSPRILQYRREGLVKPKDWGVAQQLQCGDGYVLPEIIPTSGQRAARRQIRPQTVADTRPW